MKIVRTEHHQVNSECTYEIPDEDIVEKFGSLNRFEEIVSHMGSEWDEKIGEPPTAKESDLFIEFFEDYNYNRYDDWWTDLQGGYDVTFQINNDDEGDDDYDSDEEALH